MKQIEALARLYAIQGWLHLPLTPEGRSYGPGFFRNRNWFDNLQRPNRKVSFRLRKYGCCLGCGKPISGGSTGDHLVPVSLGGPSDASNYAPLCGRCNTKKGKKDFLEWWIKSGRDLKSLMGSSTANGVPVLADLLCAYTRLVYQSTRSDRLYEEAPKYQVAALEQLKHILPKPHQEAVAEIKVQNTIAWHT